MIDSVIAHHPEDGTGIIREHLESPDPQTYQVYAAKASVLLDTSFVKPLLHALATAGDPYTSLAAARALAAYTDSAIRRQLKVAARKNRNLQKGWIAKELRELLKARNTD